MAFSVEVATVESSFSHGRLIVASPRMWTLLDILDLEVPFNELKTLLTEIESNTDWVLGKYSKGNNAIVPNLINLYSWVSCGLHDLGTTKKK